MLVLSRRKGESIQIGDQIEVTVQEIRGDKVRLGVRAPRSIPVHRTEVADRIKAEAQPQAPKGLAGAAIKGTL